MSSRGPYSASIWRTFVYLEKSAELDGWAYERHFLQTYAHRRNKSAYRIVSRIDIFLAFHFKAKPCDCHCFLDKAPYLVKTSKLRNIISGTRMHVDKKQYPPKARRIDSVADIDFQDQTKQERPVLKLMYSEMQCAITFEILFAILEFVIGFVSNFYNWCPVSLCTIQWKKMKSLY